MSTLTVEALADVISKTNNWCALTATAQAKCLLPFIERHIAAGLQGDKPFPAPGLWFPLDILGNPMREFSPSKWETAQWPSEQQGKAGGVREFSAWICDMKTSAGMDYYVCVGYGKNYGDYMTPHAYKIRGRAEYDVACWNHLFGLCEAPDILAFDTKEPAATPQPPKPAGAVPAADEELHTSVCLLREWLARLAQGKELRPDAGMHSFASEEETFRKAGIANARVNASAYLPTVEKVLAVLAAREAAGRADAVPASEGVDEDREMAVQMLALSRKPRRVQAAHQQMTTQCEGISKPISWQRQVLLLMDDVDRLVRHCAVCADTFEFYKPCADAFWKVCRMIAESETDISDPVVKALAAKCGVYYGDGKVNLGAPLYAFTPTELIAFARCLVGADHA